MRKKIMAFVFAAGLMMALAVPMFGSVGTALAHGGPDGATHGPCKIGQADDPRPGQANPDDRNGDLSGANVSAQATLGAGALAAFVVDFHTDCVEAAPGNPNP